MRKGCIHIVCLLLTVLCTRCGIYSFSGASIPAEAKINPLLSENFTTALRDAIMNQTSLDMVDSGGDLSFEGEIVDYRTTPVAITAGQTAALNRLTITVNVRFVNNFDESKNFETKFSNYVEYPSDQELNSVQESLTATIVEALVEDVFNKALVNW